LRIKGSATRNGSKEARRAQEMDSRVNENTGRHVMQRRGPHRGSLTGKVGRNGQCVRKGGGYITLCEEFKNRIREEGGRNGNLKGVTRGTRTRQDSKGQVLGGITDAYNNCEKARSKKRVDPV